MSDLAQVSGDSPDQDGRSDTSASECTNSERFYFDDGNIVIQSSDLVSFKVHNYQLMAASTVFRGMFKHNHHTPPADDIPIITPSDDALETATNVELYLGTIYHGRIADHGPRECLRIIFSYVNLGRLLQKYDCESAMESFKRHLLAMPLMSSEEPVSPDGFDTFVIAAALNLPDICKNAIKYGRNGRSWTSQASKETLAWCKSGGMIWTLKLMSIRLFEMIPHRYILAYERTVLSEDVEGKSLKTTRKDIAEQFYHLLKG